MVTSTLIDKYLTLRNTNNIAKVVIFIIIQLSIIYSFHSYTINQTKHHMESLELKLFQKNTILRGNFVRIFDTVDGLLDDIKTDLSTKDYKSWTKEDWFNYLRVTASKSLPILSYIVMYSDKGLPQGYSLSSNLKLVDISDRIYFTNSKAGKSKGYYGPYLGRLSDIWTYSTVRRLDTETGVFNGVLLGAMSIPYLSEFCKDVPTDSGIKTFVLNSEDHILLQCELNKIVIDKTNIDFYPNILGGELSPISPSSFTSRYETKNWLVFASELPNGSGLKVLTVISKDTINTMLSTVQLEKNLFMYYIFVAELGCLILYINALLNTINRRKSSSKIKVLQASDYRQDDIIVKLPESGSL